MFKKTLVSSAILAGSLVSTPAFALFWSDFQMNPPQDSRAMAVRSSEGWPDWIGKLYADLPPAVVEAGGEQEALEVSSEDEDWPSWIGRLY